MYKSYLRARETWALPAALAALMSCLWLPAARADIFISQGTSGGGRCAVKWPEANTFDWNTAEYSSMLSG